MEKPEKLFREATAQFIENELRGELDDEPGYECSGHPGRPQTTAGTGTAESMLDKGLK